MLRCLLSVHTSRHPTLNPREGFVWQSNGLPGYRFRASATAMGNAVRLRHGIGWWTTEEFCAAKILDVGHSSAWPG